MDTENCLNHCNSVQRLLGAIKADINPQFSQCIRANLAILYGFTVPMENERNTDEFLRPLIPELQSLCNELDVTPSVAPRNQVDDVLTPLDLAKVEEFLAKYRQALS